MLLIETGNKGLTKLKQMIHEMSNQTLIFEWCKVRMHNNQCSHVDDQHCVNCNLALCIGYLMYEEIATNELIDRGLFDYALNICYRNLSSYMQYLARNELIQFYS
jgi:hypothetical protein